MLKILSRAYRRSIPRAVLENLEVLESANILGVILSNSMKRIEIQSSLKPKPEPEF